MQNFFTHTRKLKLPYCK